MKETHNLSVENECFGQVYYEYLTQEMKDKALPLLMVMFMKRSGEIKSRGVANGSFQLVCTDKEECLSTTPELCSLKCTCAVAAKEERDVDDIDLLGFFL